MVVVHVVDWLEESFHLCEIREICPLGVEFGITIIKNWIALLRFS